MAKWVYMFTEGNATMRNLLGGKGANLAEMTSLGLPVPPVSYTHLDVYKRQPWMFMREFRLMSVISRQMSGK